MNNVCLISQQFPPETAWGGIATYVHLLAEGLGEAGCAVTVVSRSLTNTAIREEHGNLLVWRVPNAARLSLLPNFIARPLAVRRFLQVLNRQFDVVEYPSWAGEGALVPASAATVVAVRLVTTVRTVHAYWKSSVKERAASPILDRLESSSVHRARLRISGTASHAASAAAQFGIPRESIAIVPYGIRIPAKTPLSGAPVVLIVGRLEPRKGTEIALRAAGLVAASMPKARFVFAGQIGRDRQGTPYQDVVARDSRLSRAVTLMGRVDQASLERLREQSSVIMVPSLAESFGLTYLEAMAAGRALIAFDIPPARELLGGDGIPLVPPNSEALADAVLELLSDHDKCVQIAEAGWRLLLERYTVERMVANTLDVYRRIG